MIIWTVSRGRRCAALQLCAFRGSLSTSPVFSLVPEKTLHSIFGSTDEKSSKYSLASFATPTRKVEVDDKDATLHDPAVVAAEQAVTERLGDEGRILVRKSGTEPVLRVMVEAATHALCEENVASVIDAMQKSGHLIRVR